MRIIVHSFTEKVSHHISIYPIVMRKIYLWDFFSCLKAEELDFGQLHSGEKQLIERKAPSISEVWAIFAGYSAWPKLSLVRICS
jgi:hypothetical protein